MSFYDEVYKVVVQIPKGKVATYGQIARILCSPKASRAVGYALHFNPMPGIIPCHRVVGRDGRMADSFAFGGISSQAELLASEGVEFDEDYKVNLDKYQWEYGKKPARN